MSIRNRILAVFLLAIALGVYGFFSWLSDDLRPRYMEAQEDLMVDTAYLLAHMIEANNLTQREEQWQIETQGLRAAFEQLRGQYFEAQIYGLLKTSVDLRVYVTDAQGIVLFDSEPGRDQGRDMSQWRDVARTLEGEYGARSSADDPLFPHGSTMYVAAPIHGADEIVGVVSVGKTTRNAERFVASALPRFFMAALGTLGIAVLLSLGLYWWLSRPLHQLEQYAKELQSGEPVAPPRLGNNEIGRVGEAMARLRQALDGKAYVEDYVQTLTHELKSPTAAIAGAAELLGEDIPEQDRARFLDNIRTEAARLNRLVERMLALAEIENRDALASTELINMRELLAEALDSVAPRLHNKDLQLRHAGDGGGRVRGERFLLHRALVNLLDNAIDFSPQHGVLDVTLELQQGMVVLSLCDQGSGVPQYASQRVFERFYSLPRADGRKGTGLGLSFVKQIAALHKGTITLGNRARGGACARLRVPAASG